MFVPGDHFLSAALAARPDLIEYAMAKRVAIATPTSLIALLWAVANGWQRYRIAESAEETRQTGEEMYKRLQVFVQHYENAGKSLNTAVENFNKSVSSFDTHVVPQGRRFAQLVTGDEDGFPQPNAVDRTAASSRYALAEKPEGAEQPAQDQDEPADDIR